MDLPLILRVLRDRSHLQTHERWSEAELQAHRRHALRSLRDHAYARSEFYQKFHRGLFDAPLESLPILTKRLLMDSFDGLVTDPQVRLADVRAHLASLAGNEKYLGRYRAVRTAGTTGEPGVFLADAHEWAAIVASYERAQRWAGIRAGLTRRTRLAVVSSRTPWHQSAQVGLSVDSPFVPVRRFDAMQPLTAIVDGLNEWQPENLIAYASMARLLADEQLAGRLQIKPRAVMCASEALTDEARTRVERAWGRQPFNVYAATETAAIASECARHRMHLFDDLVITEIVDEKNRPVPPGHFGAKVLVTVLSSRTQPLIRYEISDSVATSSERCGCGLPFPLIAGVQGRAEDFVWLPGPTGEEISIHPNVFHHVLETLPVVGWQVVQEPGLLRVLLVGASADLDDARLGGDLAAELARQGAVTPAVRVERIASIERTALGKVSLIKALKRRPPERDQAPVEAEQKRPSQLA